MNNETEILSLIQSGEERPDLDYKVDIDLRADRREKAEIAKDVIAMANFGGGIIVGGVQETTSGYDFIGMPEQSLQVFDSTALNDFLKSYCDPPINTTTRKISIDDKVYGFVVVPGFADQPHIITKDYPGILQVGDILVRSASNNSVRATPHDLRKIIDKSVKLRQGVLKGFLQASLDDMRPTLVGGTTTKLENFETPFDQQEYSDTYKGFRIVKIIPENQLSIRQTDLKPMIEKATIRNPSPGYPIFPDIRVNDCTEERLPNGLVLQRTSEVWGEISFVFLDIVGRIYYTEGFREDQLEQPMEWGRVGIFFSLQKIFGAILFARQYYSQLGYEGDVEISFSIESSIPRLLYMDSHTYWSFHGNFGNEMSIPISVKRKFHTDISLEQIDELTIDMIIEFFWYFYYDLDHDRAAHYLDYVKKKHVAIPQDILPNEIEE